MNKTAKRIRILLLTLVLVLGSVVALRAQAASYKRGSSGEVVSQIQTKLKRWGYYNGAVDGIYGSGTEKAVRLFQQKNGLAVDGKVGQQTLAALGIRASSGAVNNDSNVELLARLISAEARGEPYVGQVAVGAVVMNRTRHPSFPSTIAGVIYQRGAFSCIDDGQFYQPVADSAYRAAREALAGSDPTGGAIYYYNPAKTTNKWIWSRPVLTTIGKHRFCA